MGPNVTWRLAARYADELNLDGLDPDATAEALPVIRDRCEEVGRDPATLRVSLSVDRETFNPPGAHRREMLEAYRDIGVSRLMISLHASVRSDEALEGLAEECRAAERGPRGLSASYRSSTTSSLGRGSRQRLSPVLCDDDRAALVDAELAELAQRDREMERHPRLESDVFSVRMRNFRSSTQVTGYPIPTG